MSTIKDKIEKLKQLFNSMPPGPVPAPAPAPVPAPAPAPVEFKDYPAKDGVTVLSIDKLEVGGSVKIAGAPAPDAEYELQDGTKIKVAGGLISEIEAAEPAPAPAPAPPVPPTPQQMRETLQQFAESGSADLKALTMIVQYLFEDRFGWELKREEENAKRALAIETYKNNFEDQMKKADEKLAMMMEVITEFAAIEKVEPVAKPQSFRKNQEEKQSRLDNIAKKLEEMSAAK